jgi:hypothetical protein
MSGRMRQFDIDAPGTVIDLDDASSTPFSALPRIHHGLPPSLPDRRQNRCQEQTLGIATWYSSEPELAK